MIESKSSQFIVLNYFNPQVNPCAPKNKNIDVKKKSSRGREIGSVCVYVCVCVRDRDRDKERERQKLYYTRVDQIKVKPI